MAKLGLLVKILIYAVCVVIGRQCDTLEAVPPPLRILCELGVESMQVLDLFRDVVGRPPSCRVVEEAKQLALDVSSLPCWNLRR